MDFTTLKMSGNDALRILGEHRARYSITGLHPFLIGDSEELGRVTEALRFNARGPDVIVQASFEIDTTQWIAERRAEAEEYEFSADQLLGKWPGEIYEKGSIGLHKDTVTGTIKPEVYLGLAKIEVPWHLPAVLRFGAWNECPEAEVQCAFHRHWHEKFGAEITGMSGDVVECAVRNPPTDRTAATTLAWEQYWYCADIVEQGCGSISNLAATLLNSRYWFFWWD